MKCLVRSVVLALAATQGLAASQWGFADGSVAVSAKGAGVGNGVKQKLVMDKKLPEALELGTVDTLKLLFTIHEGKTAKKAHQAFLSLKDASGLTTDFAFSVKNNGKAKLDLTQKDLPPQLVYADTPLSASLFIASFGNSKPYKAHAFELAVKREGKGASPGSSEPTTRNGKLAEIHHIFKAGPKSPPKIITLVFTLAVLGTLPVIIGAWLALGGNLDQLGQALSTSPVGHILYLGGILSMQAIFAAYYWGLTLFQVIPPALAVSVVVLFAGSRALTEVQERRLKSER